VSENDKHQSGWYESDEGHAFHAHGKDMSPETLAALKKLADAAYKHLDSLPDGATLDDDEDEEDVCRNCGRVIELVTDTPFCSMCYVMLDDDDDSEEDDLWEDPNEAIVPGTEYLLGEDIQLDEDDPDLENWYDE
jgi:hypothetical protein